MASDGWKVKVADVDGNVNANLGEEVTVEYNSREGQSVEFVNVGVDAHATLIRAETSYGGGLGEVGLEGPKAGVDVGLKVGDGGFDVGAVAEASVAKAEATLGPLYGNVGLNANTGVKLGTSGVQCNVLGFGFTLGVKGRFTFDTPVGSVGAATQSIQATQRETVTLRGREEIVLYAS